MQATRGHEHAPQYVPKLFKPLASDCAKRRTQLRFLPRTKKVHRTYEQRSNKFRNHLDACQDEKMPKE